MMVPAGNPANPANPASIPDFSPFDPGALLERITAARVLCVGDAMLDRFVYGTVDRISPEAPIPVLRVTGEALMPGAAGNVAANLVALGAAVHFATVVGADEAGRELARLIESRLGTPPRLIVDPGRETTLKTRFIAQSQQLLRADRETLAPLPAASAERLLAELRAVLPDCGAVVLSDYAKGVLCQAVLDGAIAAAGAAGRPVVVDPKGRDFTRYRGAAVLTPNRRELAEASGLPVDSDDAIEAAARTLIARAGVGAMLVTRSEEGMTVVPADGPATHLRAEAREVFDVSGAGDTVVAALAAALAAGGAAADRVDPALLVGAARLANLAGGIAVGKAGTAVVQADELAAALHLQEWARGEAKVAGLAAAVERVRHWRTRGRRVGFTNGCFDLLHPGHLALLRQARAACDRLVVGLNSDASVRRLKGDGRPVQSEAARAAVLASLECVDLVVIFAEDTPLRLIEAIRPDVLVKGADYSLDRVVGAELVQRYGGRVLLAELEAGHSTTATIARLRR